MTKLPPQYITEPDIVEPDEIREDGERPDEPGFDPEPLDDEEQPPLDPLT